jgi:hypothetical protein
VVQEPPGGPPDFAIPELVEVTPDSGSVADSLRDPVVFQFDEVISEASGGGLERLFRLSPRVERLSIDWKRTRIEVRPRRGWQPDRIYHVTMLPGIADLRNNRMEEGRHVVFSTGGPIPDTRIEGDVLDWDNGRVGVGAAVEAVLMPDSLIYEGRADSLGHFRIEALPRGTYVLYAAIDANNNGERDRREAFDSATVTLDSVVERAMWAFLQDTNGPQLAQVNPIDSITARLQFSQKLRLGEPDDTAVRAWLLPDTVAVAVAALWDTPAYDSITAAESAAADSARSAAAADSLAADSTAADSAAAPPDTTTPPIAAPPGAAGQIGDEEAAAPPDSSAALRLLPTRPPLVAVWFLRFVDPAPPGARYLVEVTAANVNGAVATSRAVLVIPEAETEESR